MRRPHTEVPATPDTTHLYALAQAARDGGVCVQDFPLSTKREQTLILDELVREAQEWGMYEDQD